MLPVLDLGRMALADALLTEEQLKQPEATYPLELAFCPECSLAQILETVPPEELFCRDYPYYSSFSEALLTHSRENVLDLIQSRHLDSRSFVVEIASNDGYLLKYFVERGIPVLGIDPAEGPAREAEKVGVPTLCEFFGVELAGRLAAEGRKADVLIANNVLAHVADTNGLVEAMRIALKDDGVVVVEAPYLRDMVERCEFDTIYHEHLCYFSATAVDRLFRRHRLFLNDIKRLPIHGGSLRLYFGLAEDVRPSVKEILAEEHRLGLDRYAYFEDFASRVQEVRRCMQELLSRLKAEGKRIAAYGAAAKGAVMLNYIGVGAETIDFVVDRNVHKQGKYMPGVHIPICDPSRLMQAKPDYAILLPWNFKDEILSQQAAYRRQGGRFIIPIPTPEIV